MNAKQEVIVACLKHGDNAFSQSEIVQETGFRQSTVSSCLSGLVEKGYLNKSPGKFGLYHITDQGEMLALAMNTKERVVVKRPDMTCFDGRKVLRLEIVRALRPFSVKNQDVLEKIVLEDLDEIIENAKMLKRWYRESTPKMQQAYATLDKEIPGGLKNLWHESDNIRYVYTRDQWEEKAEQIRMLVDNDGTSL